MTRASHKSWVTVDRAARLSLLLDVLHAGELLAAHTAARQARLAPLPWMRRALATQAQQEQQHAAMARTALQAVGAHRRVPDLLTALRARLEHDLAVADLAASLIGLQGVIEHLGEALLEFLGTREHPARALLNPLRAHVLAQEQGHVLLGGRCLAALAPPRDPDAFYIYLALGRDLAAETAGLLDDARLDGDTFWREVQSRLTSWYAQGVAAAP